MQLNVFTFFCCEDQAITRVVLNSNRFLRNIVGSSNLYT